MASLACESLVNGSNVLSSIAKRAAVSPYHSLYTFYMFYTAIPSATPRLPPSAIFIALLACESRGTGASFFLRLQNEQRSLQKERRDGTSRRSVGIADAKGAQRAECPQPYRSTLVPSLVTLFTLLCSVAERRSPLNHSHPPLHVLHVLHGQPSAHSASLRLCVKIPQSPNPSIPPKFGIIPSVRLKA